MTDQKNISTTGMKAWDVGNGEWVIATDDDRGLNAIAHVVLTTTRRRREDCSGERAFRVVVKTEGRVTARLNWNTTYTLKDPYAEYEGTLATLRKIMRWCKENRHYFHARMDLETEANKMGIPMFKVLDAYSETDQETALNLYRLIEQERTNDR